MLRRERRAVHQLRRRRAWHLEHTPSWLHPVLNEGVLGAKTGLSRSALTWTQVRMAFVGFLQGGCAPVLRGACRALGLGCDTVH